MRKLGLCLLVGTVGCATQDEVVSATPTALEGVCGSELKQLPAGHSIRILSLNTQLLSPAMALSEDIGESNADAAAAIAEYLRQGTFDVIGLQEVWDEDDGKDQLVSKLCPTYQHYVRHIDAGFPEDSGLMVFSKFPFLDLMDTTFVAEDSESSYGHDSNKIGFVPFDDCVGWDCLASKGAVMLRLGHTASPRILDFVTSHFQAATENAATRISQMRQIRGRCETGAVSSPNLISTSLGMSLNPGAGLCANQNLEWLAIAGDLNIRGEGAVRTSVHPGSATPVAGGPEWTSQFGAFSDAFALNGWSIYDPWAETTSPADLGLTVPDDGQRLDYILTSRATSSMPSLPDLCVQHIWNPPGLAGLSDHHHAVAADLNMFAPQCNPRIAHVGQDSELVVPGKFKGGVKLSRNIASPGNMQWFRYDKAGTYSFAVDNGLSFEVFLDENLSIPLAGGYFLGTDTINSCTVSESGAMTCIRKAATKFVVPTAPFYVRVFSTDRTFSGNYGFTAHRYTCESPTQACVLLPNAPAAFSFPAGTLLNIEDSAWFEVNIIDQADSGAAQTVRFHADNTGSAWTNPPALQIYNATGTAPLASIDGAPVSAQSAMTNPAGAQRAFRTAAATTNQRVLIKLRRTNPNANLTVDAGWQTNLNLIGALGQNVATLICEDETNPEVGNDEIRMRIMVDGVWRDGGFGSFDCNDYEDPKQWSANIGIIRAVTSVFIRVIEEDDFLAGGDDLSSAFPVTMLPLEGKHDVPVPHKLTWLFSDGEYRFEFQSGKSSMQ
jgi:hypothetical protein